MTALDALLPGPRQRSEPASKSSTPDTPIRDAALSTSPFGKELGRLERPPSRGEEIVRPHLGDEAAPEMPAEDVVTAAPASGLVIDPQAALRALFAAAQGAPAPTQSATAVQAAVPNIPVATDLVALAERAAGSTAPESPIASLPAERPKVTVVTQETHFAPVMPGQPTPVAAIAQKVEDHSPPQPTASAAAPIDAAPVAQPTAPPNQARPRPIEAVAAAPVVAAAAPLVEAATPVQAPAPAAIRPTRLTPRATTPAVSVGPSVPEAESRPVPAIQTGPVAPRPELDGDTSREPGQPTPEMAPVAALTSGPVEGALPAATLRHLANAIATEAPSAPVAPPGQPAKLGQMPEGPLRLLTIQLQPADLGTVTVRMRLQEGRLEVGMETGRHDTADLLRRDGGALSDLLRGAGYQADLVAIRASGADMTGGQPSQQGSGQGAQAQSQPQSQSGRGQMAFTDGGQGGGGSQPGSSDRRDTPRAETARSREGGHEAYPVERDRSGVYL
ncbi:flagellar hook-length control protein FliK [Methylobacterium komagatae]|uniref:Flagellar hook-length control protein FliK n=1 Tax=Methylobacterium komagatae TaxID=374425 RepID=A0ABW2BNG0_9HYPH